MFLNDVVSLILGDSIDLLDYTLMIDELSDQYPTVTNYLIKTSTCTLYLFWNSCSVGSNVNDAVLLLLNTIHLIRNFELKKPDRVIDASVNIMRLTRELTQTMFKRKIHYGHIFPLFFDHNIPQEELMKLADRIPPKYAAYPLTAARESQLNTHTHTHALDWLISKVGQKLKNSHIARYHKQYARCFR